MGGCKEGARETGPPSRGGPGRDRRLSRIRRAGSSRRSIRTRSPGHEEGGRRAPSYNRVRNVADTATACSEHRKEHEIAATNRQGSDRSTAYEPHAIERHWYRTWEEGGDFRARPNPDREPFSIVIPPPNVTGALHMGHALNNTLQDVLIRRARMQGFETLWVPGTDHAGIGMQNVVERELAKAGTSRQDIGREAFVERVWQWKEEYGGRIIDQLRRLGCSCDWERERFTMDEGLSRAVRTVFVRWFEDGLIYRGLRIINWCPFHTTALSDIEVEHEDVAGELITFRYPLSDGSGFIPVSTTRIETMLGDTTIAVHPDDDRYAHLVGRAVAHPFFPDRSVPIVADEAVDREFGTGAVKVTPAHDPVDFEIAERHGVEKINIFDETATLNENAGRFAGLDRYEARRAVLASLEELGLVDEVERPYVHPVGHCYRCKNEIEPWLSEQWFVAMKSLAGPAIEVVREQSVDIVPKRFEKAYLDWMDNLRDWCISRQLWWGHRIPVWYCDGCDEVFASLDDPDACRSCGSKNIRQDPDVLDTWFSSQLWPFSTLGWPDQTEDLAYFYPTNVLVTGYDILYLWVARMIFSGMYCMNDVPFRKTLMTGLVRDFEGKKMSKSAGNVMDPLDVIERYGADALRFSLVSSAVPGNDTNASEERIEGARNFANKLWNATRFVLLSVGDERPELPGSDALSLADCWILSRLDATLDAVEASYGDFSFAEMVKALYRFIWSEYCDWYIELAKLELNGSNDVTTKAVLVHVLDRILRLLHPITPFITEELWSKLRPGSTRIILSDWPGAGTYRDEGVESTIGRFQDLVGSLRRLKSDHAVPPGRRVAVSLAAGAYKQEVELMHDAIKALAKVGDIQMVEELSTSPAGARTITGAGIEVEMDLEDVIDPEVERGRIARKIEEVDEDIDRAQRKLSNEEFVAKAPEAVVSKERQKLEDAAAARAKLESQLAALGAPR